METKSIVKALSEGIQFAMAGGHNSVRTAGCTGHEVTEVYKLNRLLETWGEQAKHSSTSWTGSERDMAEHWYSLTNMCIDSMSSL